MMEQFKKTYWLTAILTATLGIVLVVWPGKTVQLCCIGIGIAITVCGVSNLVQVFTNRNLGIFSSFYVLLGIILTIVGLWLIMKPESIMALVPTIVGIVILIHGVVDFNHTLSLKNMGYQRWWIGLLMGILTIILAIVIIMNPFAAIDTVVTMIGCVLIFDGIKDIVLLILVGSTKTKVKKGMKDLETIDVDILDEEIYHDK